MKTKKLYVLDCDKQGNLRKVSVSPYDIDAEVDAITMQDHGTSVVFHVACSDFVSAINKIAAEFCQLNHHQEIETMARVDKILARAKETGILTISIGVELLASLRSLIPIDDDYTNLLDLTRDRIL